jgi:hypothetical protein
MERDTRRGLGHWKGVHSFRDSICSIGGDRKNKKSAGLKMGGSYYFYVSVAGL